MSKKYCPLSAITHSHPDKCNPACGWCVVPIAGEPHCALLDIAAIPEAVNKIPSVLNLIGATIAERR